MADRRDEFYVGYKPKAPPGLAGWVRRIVVALFALGLTIAILLATSQGEFADSVFEFGTVKRFEGRLAAAPYPVLHVEEDGGTRPHLLVEFGKQGARAKLSELDGHRVRADGQLIYRDQQRMIELTAEPVEDLGGAGGADTSRSLGRFELAGEILDSKCYLGVMKPGRGKPHRGCAARCISGGVPPLFVVADGDGNQRHLLVTGAEGEPLGPELLHLVAEPVAVAGEVVERGGLLYLEAPATAFRRVGGGDE